MWLIMIFIGTLTANQNPGHTYKVIWINSIATRFLGNYSTHIRLLGSDKVIFHFQTTITTIYHSSSYLSNNFRISSKFYQQTQNQLKMTHRVSPHCFGRKIVNRPIMNHWFFWLFPKTVFISGSPNCMAVLDHFTHKPVDLHTSLCFWAISGLYAYMSARRSPISPVISRAILRITGSR